jgi:hypothetical protein
MNLIASHRLNSTHYEEITMNYLFASKAEKKAAPIIASMGGKPCTSFDPVDLRFYLDAADTVLKAKPDFVFERPNSCIFIEMKDGFLNSHYTQESSRRALTQAYESYYRRPCDHLPYHEICTALYDAGPSTSARLDILDNSFNQSLWKQAAVQARVGWQRLVIVFAHTPPKKQAERYLDAGLIFCTLKTLPDMLRTIELSHHGIFIPFTFYSKRAGYGYSVTADHTSAKLSIDEVEASDRSKFLARVHAAQKADLEIDF